MVFEYSDHDLTGVLHHPSIHLSPAHLKSLMQQFLLGLAFIHRRGVLHRDLKGSNILLSKYGELKIADFGLARFYAPGRGNDYTNRVITQWYKPPELLFGATVYGAEVDMWSAGCALRLPPTPGWAPDADSHARRCIFLELFARRPVFQGQDEIHQLDVIFKTTGTPSPETWPGLQDLPWYELVKPKTVLASQLRESFQKCVVPAPFFDFPSVRIVLIESPQQVVEPRRPRRCRAPLVDGPRAASDRGRGARDGVFSRRPTATDARRVRSLLLPPDPPFSPTPFRSTPGLTHPLAQIGGRQGRVARVREQARSQAAAGGGRVEHLV